VRVVEPNDPMYLRHGTIEKEGKRHTYWRLVRSVRAGRKVRQQTVATLAQLDHGTGRELSKSFEIKSGFHEVCTTFHVETEPFGETDSQLV
jgi:hypothetical protein